jgi:hypothetical protein
VRSLGNIAGKSEGASGVTSLCRMPGDKHCKGTEGCLLGEQLLASGIVFSRVLSSGNNSFSLLSVSGMKRAKSVSNMVWC